MPSHLLTSLTMNEKQVILSQVKEQINRAKTLTIEDVKYPIHVLDQDDENILLMTLRAPYEDFAESKSLLHIDIVTSTVKGHDFDIVVSVAKIDVPVSFIYNLETALTTLNKRLSSRQLIIKPTNRRLEDKINFSK